MGDLMSLVLNSSGGGSITVQEPSTANARTVTFPDASGQLSLPTLMTAQASTSGTSIEFTGIPSWAKRITVLFSGVSINGSSNLQIQIGSGSFETTDYTATAGTGGSQTTATSGFLLTSTIASGDVINGIVTIVLISGSSYVSAGVLAPAGGMRLSAGSKSASAVIDRLRITTVGGTNTFDAGSINVLYE
jgi:hypothetical protein